MHDAVVLLARVGLARDELPPGEARAARQRAVELLDLGRVAVEEAAGTRPACRSRPWRRGSAGPRATARTSSRSISRSRGPERRALADGRRLRGLEVRVGERRQVAVREREVAQPAQDRDEAPLDQRERLAHLDQVARCR